MRCYSDPSLFGLNTRSLVIVVGRSRLLLVPFPGWLLSVRLCLSAGLGNAGDAVVPSFPSSVIPVA